MAAGPKRIDVHHHISPPGYIAELDPKGILTKETREWTPQQSIDEMDRGGVQVGAHLDHDAGPVVRRRRGVEEADAAVQ